MLADEPAPSSGPLSEGMAPSPSAAIAALADAREQTDGPLALKRHWRALGGAGQLALLVSVALLLCFSLPWYSLPDYHAVPRNPFPTLNATGWSTALGSPHTLWDSPLVLFPELWLVPLSALGLLGTVFLIVRGRWPPRRAFSVLLAAAGATLFAELGFFLEVQSLQAGFADSLGGPLLDLQGNTVSVANTFTVLWGFWLTGGVTAFAFWIGLYGLRRRPPGQEEDAEALPLAKQQP